MAVITLADVVGRHWPAYAEKFGTSIPPGHTRAAQAIVRCRTAEAGMVYHRCEDCGLMDASPVSCGHRACNACGHHKSMEWEARQQSRLLPVPYHMITFTIPAELREVFRKHQSLCYDLLFSESAGALTDLAADPQHLGGAIGMTGVLQTWTRDLRYHPHIHYIVPAGALTDAGWVRLKNADIFVPSKPLAARLRNRFRDALKAADFKLFLTIPSKVWSKCWRVDDRPVGRGDTAFRYLARYVQKTALDAARIVSVSDDDVTIRWTDRESGETRTAALSGEEFLRRFFQHVLPRGFRRVRHFGFLSAAAKARYERLRSLLKSAAVCLKLPEKPARCCPGCGGTALRFVCAIRVRTGRDPPRAPPPSPSP